MFSEMTKDRGFPDKISNYAALILPRKAAALATDDWEATETACCLQHNSAYNSVHMHFVLLSQVFRPSSCTQKQQPLPQQLARGKESLHSWCFGTEFAGGWGGRWMSAQSSSTTLQGGCNIPQLPILPKIQRAAINWWARMQCYQPSLGGGGRSWISSPSSMQTCKAGGWGKKAGSSFYLFKKKYYTVEAPRKEPYITTIKCRQQQGLSCKG